MKVSKINIVFLALVIVITFALTLANFVKIPFINNSKITLGLDLQGGTDILLQVELDDYIHNYQKNLINDIQKELYKSHIGYKNFSQNENGITFDIRDIENAKLVKKILHSVRAKFKQNNENFNIIITNDELSNIKKRVLEQSIEVIRKRVDELGNKEISITSIDDDKISLQIPGKNDPESIKKLLNTQAKLTFHLMDDKPFLETKNATSPNVLVLEGLENQQFYYAILKDVIIDGADLEDATATITENGEAAVSFKFNNKAAKIFGEVTTQNIGRPFAIVLDDKVLSSPNIKEPILSGSGVISGSFTTKGANDLALLLRAGALPTQIKIISQKEISATLGKEAIAMGIKSLICGCVLVCFFMFIRYKIYGFVALFSLVVNVLCVIAFLSLFNSTLTLPGIAGIILTIGMAADGNIIIFENIRYLQKKLGKKNVLSEAFSDASTSILDANITTILGGVILYQFGFGVIKGFALTLVIGTIFSIFASLFVTKVVLLHKNS